MEPHLINYNIEQFDTECISIPHFDTTQLTREVERDRFDFQSDECIDTFLEECGVNYVGV